MLCPKYFQKHLPGLGSDASGKINKSSSLLKPLSLSLALLAPMRDILTLFAKDRGQCTPPAFTYYESFEFLYKTVSVLENTSIVSRIDKYIIPRTM
jgi:hypothetical protein